jgi:hypothetical protein
MKIGDTIQRKDGNRYTNPVMIKNRGELNYYLDMQKQGFTYHVVDNALNDDFDLPEVEQKKAANPKLHVGGSTCESCES